MIESEPAVSRKEIANVLNISPETVKKYIKKLKRKSVLRRVGPAKGGHWEVV
ncbi:MAG: winged helix-turn-helix transcriptional regulator [Thermoplasmata archaeon]|nr:winged helix-turn-helix transcriptional regulator [Thermoplasmata archaeon]